MPISVFFLSKRTAICRCADIPPLESAQLLWKPEWSSAAEPVTHITFDTPAGLTRVRVDVENGIVKGVTLRNIPSFLFAADVAVNVPGLGSIRMDIAYGGNFYAILPAGAVGLEIVPEKASQLIEKGRRIKAAVNSQVKIRHPENEFINHCPFVEFYGEPTTPGAHVKNAAFFPESGIDRSPCGTGTSARVATLYAQGKHQKWPRSQ